MMRKNHPEEYAKIIDMFLSVCRQHDCYFIYQMHYDSQVETYAREKGKKIKSKFFREGVEDWFEFMRTNPADAQRAEDVEDVGPRCGDACLLHPL